MKLTESWEPLVGWQKRTTTAYNSYKLILKMCKNYIREEGANVNRSSCTALPNVHEELLFIGTMFCPMECFDGNLTISIEPEFFFQVS